MLRSTDREWGRGRQVTQGGQVSRRDEVSLHVILKPPSSGHVNLVEREGVHFGGSLFLSNRASSMLRANIDILGEEEGGCLQWVPQVLAQTRRISFSSKI